MSREMKTVVLNKGKLHIETPLGIINVTVGLTNLRDQEVEVIELLPNRYAGEPQVTVEGSTLSRFVKHKEVKRESDR